VRFTLRTAPDQRVDLSPLTPDRLSGLAPPAIERIALNTTRAALCVADLFRVRARDPARVLIEGGSARFDGVGAGMSGGEVLLDGEAGLYAGRAMQGGRLEIRGNAGDWAASGLRGGELEIVGDAGERLGGPLPGEREGMAGGTVIVRGSVGARAGDRLRRGLVVIEGDAGASPASRMLAGTLIVCGKAGALAGYLMRRGTLILAEPPESLPPTFVAAGGGDLVFVRLLARMLEPDSRRAAQLLAGRMRRFAGDTAVLGKGEILLPERPALAEHEGGSRAASE
jgi:formylmethanofuran dehydrogenase subunit C